MKTVKFLFLWIVLWLLLIGSYPQLLSPFSDTARFNCYALSFWKGTEYLSNSNAYKQSCSFVLDKNLTGKFKVLPEEYPLLSLLIFSIPLLLPFIDYGLVFSVFMLIFTLVIYYCLEKVRSLKSAVVFTILLVFGSWATVTSRFDIVPAALTLFILILAIKKHFLASYILLAFATMTKIYPVFLLIPLFIYQQQYIKSRAFKQRLLGIGVFILICTAIFIISFLVNRNNAFSSIQYFINRPVEIESVQATVIYLITPQNQLCSDYGFGSVNLYQRIDGICSQISGNKLISFVFLALEIAIILFILFKQIKYKLPLENIFLAVLLAVLATNKVLSPQFFIWIISFIAYIQWKNFSWIIFWSLVLILTTFIFPFNFSLTRNPVIPEFLPTFMLFVGIRNLMLVVITAIYLHKFLIQK